LKRSIRSGMYVWYSAAEHQQRILVRGASKQCLYLRWEFGSRNKLKLLPEKQGIERKAVLFKLVVRLNKILEYALSLFCLSYLVFL